MKKLIMLFVLISVYLFNAPLTAYADTIKPDFNKVFQHHGSIMLIIDQETNAIRYANEATSGEGDKTWLVSIIQDITASTQLAENNRMLTNAFLLVLSGIVIVMLIFSLLLLKNLKKLKAQNLEINSLSELQRTFMDADSVLISLKDEKLKYIFVNQAFKDFYNKEATEIIGCDDFDLFDAEFATLRRKSDLDVLEKKTILVDEIKWKNKIYHTTKFLVKLANGEYGVGAYIKEVTEEYNTKRKYEKTQFRNSILMDVLNRNYNSTQEQLDHVLSEILNLTESKVGYIYIYSEENQEFILNSWSKDVMAECTVVEKLTKYRLEKTGLWGEVVRQRKPIIVNDFEMPNSMKRGYPEGHVQLARFMSIPVFLDNEIVAVVGLANKEDDYDETDIYQVTVLMNGVWSAKERRERVKALEKTNLALKENEAKLQLLLDSTYEAIYGIDMKGNCTFCNNSCLKLLGYRQQNELLGKNMHWQIHHSRKDGTLLPLDQCQVFSTLIKGEGIQVDNEVLWRADGTSFDAEFFAYPQCKDGEFIGAVVTFMDITNRKKAETEIAYLSYHDSLTGLYNRRFFEEELIRLDIERNLPISIIMGDVNGLKLTNDIFGHAAGDMLLQKAAKVIKNGCRADDIIARWGGDEFIIILPKTRLEEAVVIAERIKNIFSKQSIKAIRGSISLGYDTKNLVNEDILRIMENAEEKMYSQKTLESKNIHSDTIKSIVKTLHENSPREEEHSKNVSQLSEAIGRMMNLSEAELRRLKEAAFLHDIGKIIIEESLLNKIDMLTDQEWQEIKQHPLVGYRILNSSEDTLELAKYILSHHERWDGSGYPKGLKGEAIPRLARIIALAESYDAMTNDSNFKKVMSKDEAIFEIQKNAGFQFDPDIVEIFVKMLRPSLL